MTSLRSIFSRSAALALLALLALTAGRAESQVWRLDSPPACQEQAPEVLALGGGAFAAVWQGGAEPAAVGKPRIFARFFDPHGVPRGPEFRVSGDYDAVLLDAAVNADGHILVLWHDLLRGQLRSRALSATGQPLGSEKVVFSDFVPAGLALTATNDGGFAMATVGALSVDLWRFNSLGQLQAGTPTEVEAWLSVELDPPTFQDPAVAAFGPSGVVVAWAVEDGLERSILARLVTNTIQALPVSAHGLRFQAGAEHRPRPAAAAGAAGHILVAWNEPTAQGEALRAQVFGADRQPLNVLPLDLEAPTGGMVSTPAAAADETGGDFLVAWHSLAAAPPESGAAGRVARIGADGRLTGPAIHAWDVATDRGPSLDVDPQGHATAAWQTGGVAPGPAVESCFSQGLYARRLDASSDVLAFHRGRFEARIEWTDHAGNTGEGRAIPLSNDSGYFWFFGPENVEVMVKVLDGSAVNEHIWVFYASLTDVAFTLTVTDTRRGLTRTYENPAGRLASHADSTAFPEEPPFFPGADAPASVVAPSHLPGAGGPAAGPCTDPSLPTVRRPGLCLGGRFEVEAAWHANGAIGGVGDAGGVPLTADSGTLWFFDEGNVELVVKVLDGRPVNGRFWVFYGALSDVEYTLLVRDTVTGQVRTYHNPAGRLRSHADTAAF